MTHILRPKCFQVPAPSNAHTSKHLVTKMQILYSSMSHFAWIFNSMSFYIISGWYTKFLYWVLDKKWWEKKSEQKVTHNANNWSTSFYNINITNVPSDQESGTTFGSCKIMESSQWSVYICILASHCNNHVFDTFPASLLSFCSGYLLYNIYSLSFTLKSHPSALLIIHYWIFQLISNWEDLGNYSCLWTHSSGLLLKWDPLLEGESLVLQSW